MHSDSAPVFHVVIPARFASSRLPGKPLLDIAGRPMIEWVCRRAQASGAASVTVATDDARIARAAQMAGVAAMMTDPAHASGTDRLAEVAVARQWSENTIVVNIQGDEPALPPVLIRQVAELLAQDPPAGVSTLCTPLETEAEWENRNVVKVLTTLSGRALYFSRQPVPCVREPAPEGRLAWQSPRVNRHLGLYGYRVSSLLAFAGWQEAELEVMEKLEQLRFMTHDIPVAVAIAEHSPGPGVDTRADLEAMRTLAQAEGWQESPFANQ